MTLPIDNSPEACERRGRMHIELAAMVDRYARPKFGSGLAVAQDIRFVAEVIASDIEDLTVGGLGVGAFAPKGALTHAEIDEYNKLTRWTPDGRLPRLSAEQIERVRVLLAKANSSP